MTEGSNTASVPPPAARQSALRTALAGLIGNVLEWFDFAVYGYFVSDIGKQFFPSGDHAAQQLAAFAVFAVGFLIRPVGGLVLGMVGDRIGRRALLTLSIALMGGATLALGLLPTYASIGVWAPILLVTMRLIQGFSLGGEFTGSMVYTTEKASLRMRGLISSSTAVGTTLGFILGSGSAWLINHLSSSLQGSMWQWHIPFIGNVQLSQEQLLTSGWRIPFVASVLFCVAGYFLRRGISETEAGLKAKEIRPPLFPSLMSDIIPIVRTFGIVSMTNAAYYLTFTYMVERRKTITGEAGEAFQLANTLSLLFVLFSKPLGGWLSDHTGRRRLMLLLQVASICLIYPAYRLMLYGSPTHFTYGQILLAVPLGMALGLQGAMVVEIFPLRTRVTSMSFAYSITLALAGGTAPMVSTWLIEWLNQPLAPAYYIMLHGLIGLLLMLPMKETNQSLLDE